MAKKMDLSGVKTFLFQYGERVALFGCIAVAVLLIVMGLLGASGPGTPGGAAWAPTIAIAAKKLEAQMPLGGEVDQDKVKEDTRVPPVDWRLVDAHGNPGPY